MDGTIICNNIKSLTLYEGVSWIHASHIRTYVNRFLGPSIYKREVFLHYIYIYIYIYMGPGVALWLRHCATSRKVPGSIPGGVT